MRGNVENAGAQITKRAREGVTGSKKTYVVNVLTNQKKNATALNVQTFSCPIFYN